ncbi:hypothetical protein BEP19_06565 [Ammoniphilus oxalaticus]|uniref:DUF4446 domain-containing protein n=1 Tax=Ammoniphilus oxalaticus TaxID=66863 RepID=A0A419SJB5_9BACL|nr:DUF4446 family protein [Ammoniphilus oxalaticus]RKD24067.1 hypothetical protein BEP19_06565 [Ammoniphilus oxalaticus]
MNTWSESDILYFIIGIQAFITIVCFIWLSRLSRNLNRIKYLFQQLQSGDAKENLPQVLERLIERVEQTEQIQHTLAQRIGLTDQTLKQLKGNVAVVRFNAFANEGSDLSFSIAVIDDEQTGFVLTSIYGRDESRVYAKPLEKGDSIYNLTNEEKQAILEARKVLS